MKKIKQIKAKKSLVLLAALCLVCLIVMVLALTLGRKTVVNFEPPPFDSAALAGTPSNVENESYGPLDATAYSFSVCGRPTVEDGAALLWLTNPKSNEVWLKARILDTAGNILGESGLLRPGEYVQAVALTTPPTEDKEATLLIMSYEPTTYHSMGNVTLHTTLVYK